MSCLVVSAFLSCSWSVVSALTLVFIHFFQNLAEKRKKKKSLISA